MSAQTDREALIAKLATADPKAAVFVERAGVNARWYDLLGAVEDVRTALSAQAPDPKATADDEVAAGQNCGFCAPGECTHEIAEAQATEAKPCIGSGVHRSHTYPVWDGVDKEYWCHGVPAAGAKPCDKKTLHDPHQWRICSPGAPVLSCPGVHCHHTGIGLPGCIICDPRTISEGGPRPDARERVPAPGAKPETTP
jgi:hypothetical protein